MSLALAAVAVVVAVDWVLGVATYFAVPTLGPVYTEPQDFSGLPHTYVSTLQESTLQESTLLHLRPWVRVSPWGG